MRATAAAEPDDRGGGAALDISHDDDGERIFLRKNKEEEITAEIGLPLHITTCALRTEKKREKENR